MSFSLTFSVEVIGISYSQQPQTCTGRRQKECNTGTCVACHCCDKYTWYSLGDWGGEQGSGEGDRGVGRGAGERRKGRVIILKKVLLSSFVGHLSQVRKSLHIPLKTMMNLIQQKHDPAATKANG